MKELSLCRFEIYNEMKSDYIITNRPAPNMLVVKYNML